MKKVMLVEDEDLILEGLCNIIDWEGLSLEVVHKAHNGKEALEFWEKEPVDIVVTDIEMPVMDGITLLEKLREKDEKVRFIILTGYESFEYARSVIHFGVEDYILKPIDEEMLEEILKKTINKLDEKKSKDARKIEDKIGWKKFLGEQISKEEAALYIGILPKLEKNQIIAAAVMKIDSKSLRMGDVSELLMELYKEEEKLRVINLGTDIFLLIYYHDCNSKSVSADELQKEIHQYFSRVQNELESECGIFTFISVSSYFENYDELPKRYQEAMRLQKYCVLDGYGSCVDDGHIRNRTSQDVNIDEVMLRKMILQKDQEGALNYVEDLFINNIKENADMNTLYQMTLKIAMTLWEVKSEYNLEQKNMQDLSGMIEQIYHAEDIFGVKRIFISEIIEIITYLHTADSHYTPVVKQIMTEVKENYRKDMNLKTLAYKYHMNASYLGQIFQKEVGCSFTQYLSNTKNSVAKDLILNTNKRINDIAKEVGYTDTSYFYRKFKQCYGVSPASLREMKKY